MRNALWIGLGLLLAVPAQAGGDDETISRSRGKKGGVVVLWPRIVPETQDGAIDALGTELQARLTQIAQRTVDPAMVMVRPAPERACPLNGCKATTLSVVLGHQEGGCFAVGLVGGADGGTVQLFPLAGSVRASSREVDFRDPPENKLLVTEFIPCDDLLGALDDAKLKAALAKAVLE